MYRTILVILSLASLGAAALLGEASVANALTACHRKHATEITGRTYDSPFAYCAAVGTIDSPDKLYTGPEMPASIVRAMIRQGIVSAGAPQTFRRHAVWRCMNNAVWVCFFGANIPCLEKADVSRTPTAAMEEYCSENAGAKSIPAYVTGRATVYEWGCRNGKPEVVRQIFKVGPRGYLADFWHELRPHF
jgi:hypothetical protein